MQRLSYIYIFLVFITAGCKSPSDAADSHEGHMHDEEEAAPENTEEVHLLQQQIDVMNIEIGTFQYLNLSTTVKANGQLELPPKNKASVSAVMGGRIKSIHVLPGDFVTKNKTLATLEHPDFIQMQQEFMQAKSELVFLEQEYNRKKSLFADSITSHKSLQLAESDYMSKLALVNGIRAKLVILGVSTEAVEAGEFATSIPIRSPISGYVRLVEVNMGKYIQPEQELFEIVDNDHIHIDLTVYEKDISKVKNGQEVVFALATNPDSVFRGKIFVVGRSFDNDTKAMLVHAEIENKSGNLYPGMYVDARIITNNDKVRALPNDAIVRDGGLDYIFVLQPASEREHGHTHEGDNDDHSNEFIFRKVEVNSGASDVGFTEVVPADPLTDESRIVTKGAFYLLAEMKKGEGGHGHHH